MSGPLLMREDDLTASEYRGAPLESVWVWSDLRSQWRCVLSPNHLKAKERIFLGFRSLETPKVHVRDSARVRAGP